MDIKEHTQPEKLERYAFLWSEARLVLSAITLFLAALSGSAIPLAIKLTGSYGLMGISGLVWILSGIASAYLLYQWFKNGKTVFGGNNQTDRIAFLVSIVFGINLGLAGLGNNIALGIAYRLPDVITVLSFVVGGLVYLWAAWHLWKGWKANGEHLFGGQLSKQTVQPPAAEQPLDHSAQ